RQRGLALSRRSASRPGLAAGSGALTAWNRFEHHSALVAAASPGRLALRLLAFSLQPLAFSLREMAKAEISWKRVNEEGIKLQVYVQHVSREWRFFARERRYDQWQPVPNPPLEDWLELLDAVQRLINRRRLRPE